MGEDRGSSPLRVATLILESPKLKCKNVMEGKNVRTLEEQDQLEEKIFPIIEKLIKFIFPDGKISTGELREGYGRVLKVHVNEVGSDELLTLASLVKEKQAIVCLRRSGTGITIVIHFSAAE